MHHHSLQIHVRNLIFLSFFIAHIQSVAKTKRFYYTNISQIFTFKGIHTTYIQSLKTSQLHPAQLQFQEKHFAAASRNTASKHPALCDLASPGGGTWRSWKNVLTLSSRKSFQISFLLTRILDRMCSFKSRYSTTGVLCLS